MNERTRGTTESATAAVSAVRKCADAMQSQASSLLQTLPGLAMQETLRTSALVLAAKLKDTSQRVMFELALLQTELGEGKADAAAVVWRLSGLDAALLKALQNAKKATGALEAILPRRPRAPAAGGAGLSGQ